MSNLRMYEGKNVSILADNEKEYVGYVSDYVFPEDNEPDEIEGIIIVTADKKESIQFNADEIISIEII